jgi:hypothetical protein
MLRKLAAAAIAASLIAGSAFAQGTPQGTAPAANTPAAKPAFTTGAKIKETGAVTTPARKHVTIVKHNRTHARHHVRVTHVKHFKHVKQVKRFHQPVKHKIAG